MTALQVFNIVVNVVAGFALFVLFLLQFDLWNRWHSSVRSILTECGTCNSTKALKSSAQQFAVYWAIQRAKFWDAIVDKLGKTYAPWPFLITVAATISKLQSLSTQKQGLTDLLSETQPILYCALVGELVTIGLLIHIHRHITAFRAMFPAELD